MYTELCSIWFTRLFGSFGIFHFCFQFNFSVFENSSIGLFLITRLQWPFRSSAQVVKCWSERSTNSMMVAIIILMDSIHLIREVNFVGVKGVVAASYRLALGKAGWLITQSHTLGGGRFDINKVGKCLLTLSSSRKLQLHGLNVLLLPVAWIIHCSWIFAFKYGEWMLPVNRCIKHNNVDHDWLYI